MATWIFSERRHHTSMAFDGIQLLPDLGSVDGDGLKGRYELYIKPQG